MHDRPSSQVSRFLDEANATYADRTARRMPRSSGPCAHRPCLRVAPVQSPSTVCERVTACTTHEAWSRRTPGLVVVGVSCSFTMSWKPTMDEALQVGTVCACLPRRPLRSSGGRPFVSVVSLHALMAGDCARAARWGTARDDRRGSEAQREDVSRARLHATRAPPYSRARPAASPHIAHTAIACSTHPGAWRARTHARTRLPDAHATASDARLSARACRVGLVAVCGWDACVRCAVGSIVPISRPPTRSRWEPPASVACALGCAGEAWACVGRHKRA